MVMEFEVPDLIDDVQEDPKDVAQADQAAEILEADDAAETAAAEVEPPAESAPDETEEEEQSDYNPEQMAEVLEVMDRICDAQTNARKLERKYNDLKEMTRQAKKHWEEAEEELDEAIADAKQLAKQKPAAQPPAKEEPAAGNPPGEDDDSWKDYLITGLEMPDTLIERLQEAGIETIGDLENLRQEISLGKAKWPKGIGEAKQTIIENAAIDWMACWARGDFNPEPDPESEPESEAELDESQLAEKEDAEAVASVSIDDL